jgi:glutamate:Na+ symporter, ESS family
LLLTWLVIQPLYDVPNAFGMLIETGFAGGHGTATAMGQIFLTPEIAFPVGQDLGLLMATAGLVYGTISGILWINLAVRAGWATPQAERPLTGEPEVVEPPADQRRSERRPVGRALETGPMRPRRLALQVTWICAAFLVGIALQTGVGMLAQWLDNMVVEPIAVEPQALQQSDSPVLQKLRWVSLVGSFPLFIYTLFGGLFIAQLLASAGRASWLDGQAGGRISSVAMDLLVVAAITTLNLEAVAALLVPVAILFVGGAVWSAVCLFALSPRILPRSHWFELGLINYGMSTGVTATGFVLLRLVDPQLRTDAAKHYALAAPLSAPFVGGGLITIGLPLLVLQRVPIGLSAVVAVVVVALLIVLGMRLGRDGRSRHR